LWTRGGARRGHAAATRDMQSARVLVGRMPRTTDKHSTAPCVVWYGARAVLPVVPLVLLLVLLCAHPGLGEFLPINAPMREEPCVCGGHHGVREVVRDLGQGHVLLPPCRVLACPPGFDTALELHYGEGRGDKSQRAEPQEAQAVEAQPQAQAKAHHPAERPAPTPVEPS
jgi:hypothetical protein